MIGDPPLIGAVQLTTRSDPKNVVVGAAGMFGVYADKIETGAE
jgi:hypothetical protein